MGIIIACLLKKGIEPDEHLRLCSALVCDSTFLKGYPRKKHHMYGYTHTHTYTHLYLEVPSSHDDLNFKTFKFDYVRLLCELIN